MDIQTKDGLLEAGVGVLMGFLALVLIFYSLESVNRHSNLRIQDRCVEQFDIAWTQYARAHHAGICITENDTLIKFRIDERLLRRYEPIPRNSQAQVRDAIHNHNQTEIGR